MTIKTSVIISASPESIWKVVTDIKNAAHTIKGISKIEIINQPKDGIIGLKWKETRTVFGKEATETMWITQAKENEFYHTRAESHGSIYKSSIILSPKGNQTELTMVFEGKPQTLWAKIMSKVFASMMAKSIKKCFEEDLADIKVAVE